MLKLNLRKIFLFGGDVFLLYVSLLTTVLLRFWESISWGLIWKHLLPFTILYVFWLVILYLFGFYDLRSIKSRFYFYPKIFGVLLAEFLLGISFFYSVPFFGISPKTNLALNVLIFGFLFICWRLFFWYLFSGHFLSKAAMLGRGAEIEKLKKELLERPYLGQKFISIKPESDLFSQIQEQSIDTVIFSEEYEAHPELLKAMYLCLPDKVNFWNFRQAYAIISQKIPSSFIDQTWVLENIKEKEKEFYHKIKRGLSLTLTIMLLIITSPLWLLIALAIKFEDRGPVFYTQERIGKNKAPFLLIKFRSMREDAEKQGPVWAQKKDPRVTKVGKFLRRTHLDELPQLANVLRGEISLVGPRPERPAFVQKLENEIPYYHVRHLIKPGLTGWAQIKFHYARTIMDSREKFHYDLYYIKNRSFFLDLSILLKTFQLFFRKDY